MYTITLSSSASVLSMSSIKCQFTYLHDVMREFGLVQATCIHCIVSLMLVFCCVVCAADIKLGSLNCASIEGHVMLTV